MPPTPRRISFLAMAQARLGSKLQIIGWLTTAFFFIFVLFFTRETDFLSLVTSEDSAIRRPATIVSVKKSGAQDNKQPIYQVDFSARGLDGEIGTYRSYMTGHAPSPGSSATALFFERWPDAPVLEGGHRKPFGSFVTLLTFLFLPIGFFPLIKGWNQRRYWIHLMRHGKLSRAMLKSREPTSVTVGSQRVEKLTFSFFDETGQDHTFVLETHEVAGLEDDPTEPILYDPEHPEVALPLDALIDFALDDDRRIVPYAPLAAFVVLLVPFISIVLGIGGVTFR